MKTRPAGELTLADRLSHLTHAQPCHLLGPRAKELLREGGGYEIEIEEQARLEPERLALELADARVEIGLAAGERHGLAVRCSACTEACEHAAAALDSSVEAVDMLSNLDDLRQRLEVLLGAKPEPGVDLRERETRESELAQRASRERVAAAGGELVRAAAAFLGALFPDTELGSAAGKLGEILRTRLSDGLGRDEAGRTTLRLTLPDAPVLESLAGSLVGLLGGDVPSATPAGDGVARRSDASRPGTRRGNGAPERPAGRGSIAAWPGPG